MLFSVKAFDTEAAAARLEPLLGEGTAVLSLQNGVDNEEKLAQAIGPAHVMGGAAFICQAGMTAAVRLPIGELRTVDAAWVGSSGWSPRSPRSPRRTGYRSRWPPRSGPELGPERRAGQLLVAA